MTPDEFVKAVKTVVIRGTERGISSILRKPPGRAPEPKLVELSEWFIQLSNGDQQKVEQAISEAAQQACYNFLLILDGLTPIESSELKGELELIYKKGHRQILLNNPSQDFLTDIFKSPI